MSYLWHDRVQVKWICFHHHFGTNRIWIHRATIYVHHQVQTTQRCSQVIRWYYTAISLITWGRKTRPRFQFGIHKLPAVNADFSDSCIDLTVSGYEICPKSTPRRSSDLSEARTETVIPLDETANDGTTWFARSVYLFTEFFAFVGFFHY